jgi:hypothetical protein
MEAGLFPGGRIEAAEFSKNLAVKHKLQPSTGGAL